MYHQHHHHHHTHSWNYCYVCNVKYCECGEESRIYDRYPWVEPYNPWNPYPWKKDIFFLNSTSHSH